MKFEKEMAIIYFQFGLIMGLESRGVYMRKKRKIQKCRHSHKVTGPNEKQNIANQKQLNISHQALHLKGSNFRGLNKMKYTSTKTPLCFWPS